MRIRNKALAALKGSRASRKQEWLLQRMEWAERVLQLGFLRLPGAAEILEPILASEWRMWHYRDRRAIQNSYPYPNEPTWSKSEKAIARKAFDAALAQELHQVIQEAKRMAREIKQSSDLWDLELHLTQRRKEIDGKYDFRGSRLTHVLGRLVYEGRVDEEQLRGLREDKLKSIRSHAKFLLEEADAA